MLVPVSIPVRLRFMGEWPPPGVSLEINMFSGVRPKRGVVFNAPPAIN